MRIVRVTHGEAHLVQAGAALFDAPPSPAWTERFLQSEGHHLLMAVDEVGAPLGFVTGVETTHPDKGTEMFLYELAVSEPRRNEGIGRALVRGLADLAREHGCYGMWVGTEPGNAAALACYCAAGASPPEPYVTLEWRFADR
jgi:ribosomal protein S18 acetylase RimI-like enzyme